MDPLSKRLNSMFPMIQVPIDENKSYNTNHLLFIDDLKILAKTDETLKIIMEEFKDYLKQWD